MRVTSTATPHRSPGHLLMLLLCTDVLLVVPRVVLPQEIYYFHQAIRSALHSFAAEARALRATEGRVTTAQVCGNVAVVRGPGRAGLSRVALGQASSLHARCFPQILYLLYRACMCLPAVSQH